MTAMHDFYVYISYWLDPFFLIYFSIINIVYTILLFFGSIKVYQRRKELRIEDFTHLLRSNSLPEISFLLPAYNEAHNIISVVSNLLGLSYRYKQIILINDGSTDNMFDLLKEQYHLIPIPRYYDEVIPTKTVRGVYRSTTHSELIVIDKENGEKYDALNAGLNACKDPYYISIDADTYIDNPGFEALIRPMLAYPKTIAIGASLRIRNGCTLNFNRISTDRFPLNFVTAMQSIEYLRAFLMRQGWDFIGGNYILSGAFSMFRTDAVKWAGGYAPTVADDLEITLRLNRMFKATQKPYIIKYLPDPVGWTEGPSTIKALSRQRFLWHRGTMEAAWFHRCFFFNFKYGRYGLFVYPFLIFGEILEPAVEALGYIYIIIGLWLGIINAYYLFLLLATIWGFVLIFSLCCLLIEELSFRKYPTLRSMSYLFLYSLLENFGFRQLTVLWRLRGIKGFFKRYHLIRIDSKNINAMVEGIYKKTQRSR